MLKISQSFLKYENIYFIFSSLSELCISDIDLMMEMLIICPAFWNHTFLLITFLH